MNSFFNSFVRHHHEAIRFGYRCFDRIVCFARIPAFLNLGAVVRFLKDRRQADQLTPAYFRGISGAYHTWLAAKTQDASIPLVDAPSDPQVRRHDWVRPYFEQLGSRHGTAVILKARERARVVVSFPSRNCHLEQAYRFVNVYYFYRNDPRCGRLFLRLCPYFPFNVQLCLNGHEFLTQQLRQQGIAFRQQDNALLDCAAPQRLQELADAFGPADINQALENALTDWLDYFTPADQAEGYRFQAYLAQIEYCDNLIFHKRAALHRLFERLLDVNRSIGRPDKLAAVFGRPNFYPDTRTGQTAVKITSLRTPVITSAFRQTSVKQYVKSNTLLRTETASHQLKDLSLRKAVQHLDAVKKVFHAGNQRYLDIQQDILTTFVDRDQLQQLRRPSVSAKGRRTPGLRLEDVRLLALWQALTCFVHTVSKDSFRTKDLLPEVQRVLQQPDYKLSQLRYDLAKLRCKGLVNRIPNSQCYQITSTGYRIAVFYHKIYHRLLAPVTAAILEPAPQDGSILRRQLSKLDRLYQTFKKDLDRLTDFLGLAA